MTSDDLSVRDMKEIAEMLSGTTRVLTVLLGVLEWEVMTQFLVEAVVLSSFGGVFGIERALAVSIGLARVL